MMPSPYWLPNQHAVSIAVEAVSGRHRATISGKHKLASRQCANQHQERRAREVKIREKLIDHRESMTWTNEDIRGSPSRQDQFVSAACQAPSLSGIHESAHYGRAHGANHPLRARR